MEEVECCSIKSERGGGRRRWKRRRRRPPMNLELCFASRAKGTLNQEEEKEGVRRRGDERQIHA